MNRHTAKDRFSFQQGFLTIALALVPCVLAFIDLQLAYAGTILFIGLGSAVVVLFKVAGVVGHYCSRSPIRVEPREVEALNGADLPVYSVLCPLYDEPALVEQLLTALSELDYPRDRLDIILLLEASDAATIRSVELQTERLRALGGRLLVVSDDAGPRTKPRACNAGLDVARGEFLTIYDAEDWPEGDQLRKAVVAFRSGAPRIACLQAKLNYHNFDKNLLTRLFTLEYTAWYDVFLPGLRSIRAVIPLGGTSNHFRTRVLRKLGGWDAYNVTEDCDLGIRLARAGFETELLESTTWEEACAEYGAWVRQRSKWVKGYLQTLVTHTRGTRSLVSDLGTYKAATVILTVGGSVFSFATLLPAVFLNAAALFAYLRDPLWRPDELSIGLSLSLLSFFPYFIIVHMVAAQQRRRFSLLPHALLLPMYWLLGSIAALRGIYQFFTTPFQWEKTPHFAVAFGAQLSGGAPVTEAGGMPGTLTTCHPQASLQVPRTHGELRSEGRYAQALLALGTATALLVLPSALLRSEPLHEREFAVEVNESWFGRRGVRVEAKLTSAPLGPDLRNLKALSKVFMLVDDGEWYEHEIASFELTGSQVAFSVDLEHDWQPKRDGHAWNGHFLRHVRKFGVRQLIPSGLRLPELELTRIEPWGTSDAEPIEIAVQEAFPPRAETYQVVEARFGTGREWTNPFDAEEVRWQAVFETPSGSAISVPAFYTRDYTRHFEGEREVLEPSSDFYWAVRFAAPEPGRYRWHIEGQDRAGGRAQTSVRALDVSISKRRGYVRIDGQSGRFYFSNGESYYPLGINIGTPRDGRGHCYDFILPSNDRGGALMESYLQYMAKSGITLGRVWLAPWFGGLEWRSDVAGFHGRGLFNLQNAARIDRLLTSAETLGIHLELLLYPHGPYQPKYLEPWGESADSQWPDNPYNADNGGPVLRAEDFLSNAAARRGSKNYLRYVAARFGAYSSVQSWDLWNEVDTVTTDVAVLADWHRQLAPVLRENDLGKHLISTGFRQTGHAEVWGISELDYVQSEAYDHGTGNGLIDRFEHRMAALENHGKPIVISEFGGAWWGGSMDRLAQNIHDGLWAGWMLGLPSAPMAWWWNLIIEKDLGRIHRVFSEYVAGEDLRGRTWKPTHPRVTPDELAARAYQSSDAAYVWVFDPKITEGVEEASPRIRHLFGAGPKPEQDVAVAPLHPRYLSHDMQLFSEVPAGEVELENLAPGRYRVELWDTWAVRPPARSVLVVSANVARIALPPLTRDVALKLERIP